MKFLKSENMWSLTPDARLDVRDALPTGNYTICQNPMTKDYYLEESEPFAVPARLFGKTRKYGERILDAFTRRDGDSQIGVLLSGTKGSGKTLLAKHIACESGLPVIIVNMPFADDRFMRTIQGITQPAVVIFDEFEKLYDREAQEAILTLFDGVYTARNKIMIITCNDKFAVQGFFHNRPGRIRYSISFEGLDADFIEEFCNEKLDDQSYLDKIIALAATCDEFNFDMLQSLVRELNQYGGDLEDAVEILNVKPMIGGRQPRWITTVETPDEAGMMWRVVSGLTREVSPIMEISSDSHGKLIMIDVAPAVAKPLRANDDEDEDSDDEIIGLYLTSEDLFQVDPYAGTYTFKKNERGHDFVISISETRDSGVTTKTYVPAKRAPRARKQLITLGG